MRDAAAAFGSRGRRRAATAIALFGTLLLTGCNKFPQDPENTLGAIRERGIVRVGIEQAVPREAGDLLREVERATGAKARIVKAGVEPLLVKLDAGEIDLVIAPFGKETPWATEAALSPPLRTEGKGEKVVEWRAAMRSGENRWIMLVETRARRVSSAPGAS